MKKIGDELKAKQLPDVVISMAALCCRSNSHLSLFGRRDFLRKKFSSFNFNLLVKACIRSTSLIYGACSLTFFLCIKQKALVYHKVVMEQEAGEEIGQIRHLPLAAFIRHRCCHTDCGGGY
ncbi:hypothetical protein Dimus_030036 [Dionaea muscipula]